MRRNEKETVTFVSDSPIDGGHQERREESPSEAKWLLSAMVVGACLAGVLWFMLAIRLAFFSAFD